MSSINNSTSDSETPAILKMGSQLEMWSVICDYLIFFGFLIGSTLFPLWSSLIRRKKATDQENTKASYVFATGQVGIFAMMLSIARGTIGVRAFLGKLIKIWNWLFLFVRLLFLNLSAFTLIKHLWRDDFLIINHKWKLMNDYHCHLYSGMRITISWQCVIYAMSCHVMSCK